jgi:hypothetical protein
MGMRLVDDVRIATAISATFSASCTLSTAVVTGPLPGAPDPPVEMVIRLYYATHIAPVSRLCELIRGYDLVALTSFNTLTPAIASPTSKSTWSTLVQVHHDLTIRLNAVFRCLRPLRSLPALGVSTTGWLRNGWSV